VGRNGSKIIVENEYLFYSRGPASGQVKGLRSIFAESEGALCVGECLIVCHFYLSPPSLASFCAYACHLSAVDNSNSPMWLQSTPKDVVIMCKEHGPSPSGFSRLHAREYVTTVTVAGVGVRLGWRPVV